MQKHVRIAATKVERTCTQMDSTDNTDWEIIESVTEYETGWYSGGYDHVVQPDLSEKRYYWASLPPAVVIVARISPTTVVSALEKSVADDSVDHIVFVQQYRPTIRETHLELPAGIVESGESFTQAGARELEEETGFRPSSTSLLQSYSVATGVLRHTRGVVFADGLEPGKRKLDGNEFLEVTSVPITDVISLARDAPANDSTVSALLLAKEDGLLDL